MVDANNVNVTAKVTHTGESDVQMEQMRLEPKPTEEQLYEIHVPQFLNHCSGPDISEVRRDNSAFVIKSRALREWAASPKWETFRRLLLLDFL